MTQKEAVEKLKAWLPKEAYFSIPDLFKETMETEELDGFYYGVLTYYSEYDITKGLYHFSQVRCCDGDDPTIEETFLQTPCICIKVSKNNHIVWFKEHLPYKGGCK